MSIHFDRPVGVAGDIKELEYVSALHQTDMTSVRIDGSLRDEDVRLFLLSRYGIDVTVEHVRETVMKGLGGGSGDDECMDLMEMVAILLIPALLKAAKAETEDETLDSKLAIPKVGLLDFVLGMILQDVTGSQAPKELTPALVKNILQAYGEAEIAENDKLVEEMVQAATYVGDDSSIMGKEVTTTATCKLDLNSFARALTYDLKLYDLSNEIRMSSNFDDIFMTHNKYDEDLRASSKDDDDKDDEEATTISREDRDQLTQPVKHRFTASAIDFAAGTYRSKGLTVLLWAAFIVTYFAYNYNYASDTFDNSCVAYNYTYVDPWTKNQETMVCQISAGVVQWLLVFIYASLFGMVFVGLGSIGNSVQTTRFYLPLIGFGIVFAMTFVPFWDSFGSAGQLSKLSNDFLRTVSLVLGMTICLLHLLHSLSLLVPSLFRLIPKTRKRYFALTGTLLGEVYIKQAAAYKIGEMVRNAVDVLKMRDHDGVVDTYFGHALLSFSKNGKLFQDAGGYVWTWKRVFSSELLNREGIWFSARFLASNFAQYIVSVFVLLAGIGLTISSKRNFNKDNAKRIVRNILDQALAVNANQSTVNALIAQIGSKVSEYALKQANCSDTTYQTALDTACSYLGGIIKCDPNATVNYVCALANLTMANQTAFSSTVQAEQIAYLQAAGFDTSGTQALIRQAIEEATNASLDSFYPSQPFMVVLPVAVATIVAFVVSLYLATTYLPSVTTTTLMLRSGVIPSLRDKKFHQYRVAADQVTIVTGSMFWGALISSVLVGGLVALIIFLFIWQVTVVFVQRYLAFVIGILTIVIIKLLLVVLTCRFTLYQGFYRRRPAIANLSALTLECANFALSAGFVFLRMIKLLFTAAVFVGRIDTPFLAPGVGQVGPLQLDYYPYIYRKDILASEAHRHPYIETLGVMYLMKLRYGENFGKTAGSCWRLLFVYALMPWLHRYRVLARPELRATTNDGGPVSFARMQSLKSMRVLFQDVDHDIDDDDDNEIEVVNNSTAPPQPRQLSTRKYLNKRSFAHDEENAVALAHAASEDADFAGFAKLQLENEQLRKEIDELKKSQITDGAGVSGEKGQDIESW